MTCRFLSALLLLSVGACSTYEDPDIKKREARLEEWRRISSVHWEARSVAPLQTERETPRILLAEFAVRYGLEAQVPVELKRTLPADLLREYKAIAPAVNRELLPADRAAALPSYGRMKGKGLRELSDAEVQSPEGWVPVEGLKLLDASTADFKAAAADLLREADADIVLRVRLWMAPAGEGQLAIEAGSTVTAITAAGVTDLLLREPIISNERILEPPRPDGKRVLNPGYFKDACATLFRKFIGSAMLVAKRR